MTGRRENRIRAYRYIVERIAQLSQPLIYEPEKLLADVGDVSLDDLAKLREGIGDPPRGLVEALRKFLRAATSDAEIDEYLVTPFAPEE